MAVVPRCTRRSSTGTPGTPPSRSRPRTAPAATAPAPVGTARPAAPTPTGLLEELPLAGDILPGLPPELKAKLLAAFGIEILWKKTEGQATVHAEITDATLRALPAILDPGQDGYDDTSEPSSADPESVGDLFDFPITLGAFLVHDNRSC